MRIDRVRSTTNPYYSSPNWRVIDTRKMSSDDVVILATNDTHAKLLVQDEHEGLAYLASAIKRERAKGEILLLDAGDSISGGQALVQFMKGLPVIKAFNYLGYNATTVGNHEFDYGTQVLKRLISQANYPFLSANLTVDDTPCPLHRTQVQR